MIPVSVISNRKRGTYIKELTDMTLEELWQLFPVDQVPHNTAWSEWYEDEKKYLSQILPISEKITYYHIGSSAIPSIHSKNIVDILIEFNSLEEMRTASEQLVVNGYILMSSTKNRISLNKGYTTTGFAERVFHIHLRVKGDIDEVYFRDYLNEHIDIAKEYETLKEELKEKFKYNRDAYTESKTEFFQNCTEISKRKDYNKQC